LVSELGISGFDLIKLDIEGAEKELLLYDNGQWLKHCTIFIIELHDHLAPGAGEALLNAVMSWGPFRVHISGEYLVFIRANEVAEYKLNAVQEEN
jgi:hypothetical protein